MEPISAGITGGAQVVGGTLGFIGARKRQKRQHRYNKEYMDINQRYTEQNMAKNQEYTQQNMAKTQGYTKENMQLQKDLDKKMWDETNYEAQRKHMEKAGLNVGLMYGMAGQGGIAGGTAPAGASGAGGSGSGGGAVGGGAAAENEIEASMEGMAMMAQIKNIMAQTKKTEAEADNIGFDNAVREGVGTEEFIRKTEAELAAERSKNVRDYREAESLMEVLNRPTGRKELDFKFIIDKFGSYAEDGNWKELSENRARVLLSEWDRFKLELDELNQRKNTSEAEEELKRVEKSIMDFKETLTDFGLNETTTKILEMMMKLLVRR